MLCVARDKERPVILEFTSFQDTIMFNKRSRFGLEKVKNSKINIYAQYTIIWWMQLVDIWNL